MDAVFSLHRLRVSFRAAGRVCFAQMAANTLRGAFGYALRKTAPDQFESIFTPRARGHFPSGLADRPRPFVFRSAHLNNAVFEPGRSLGFDVHVFETRRPLIELFTAALSEMGQRGVGPAAGRMDLTSIESAPLAFSLAAPPTAVDSLTVEFLTPTELKADGGLVSEPLFPILFARVRDRIATLQSLYGNSPFNFDFRVMGERAAAVQMTASSIRAVESTRRSSRTGQRHPIGGFVGAATYSGPLAEFLPWLQAAVFTGVGRQTTWGKGELRVRAR